MAKGARLCLLALALAGCVAPPTPEQNTCGTDGMQGLIGRDKSVFAAMTLPAGTRIISPGMAITEDYRPSRLNIDLDKAGRIVRVWCG